MSRVLYTGVILDNESREKLLNKVKSIIPKDWNVICHHMTITLGELHDKSVLDDVVILKVTRVGIDDKVMAVEVEVKDEIVLNLVKNKIPHVTIAVNTGVGKPKDSNNLEKWVDIEPLIITGKIKEVKS